MLTPPADAGCRGLDFCLLKLKDLLSDFSSSCLGFFGRQTSRELLRLNKLALIFGDRIGFELECG